MFLLSNILLALGLLFSLETQLRIAGLPLGPGEVCLALALGSLALQAVLERGARMNGPLCLLGAFWLAFLLAQCLGGLVAGVLGDPRDDSLVLHDIATYPILIAISLLVPFGSRMQIRLRQSTWLFVVTGALSLGVQLANAAGLFNLASVDPWYWDRLRGWTANPNQLALLSAIVLLLALHVAETAASPGGRILAATLATFPLMAGLMSKTNAFNLALVIGTLLFAGLKVQGTLLKTKRRLTFGLVSSWVAVACVPIMLVAAIPAARAVIDNLPAETFTRDDPSKTSEDANVRLELWSGAINRGFESGLLGLGPGPHLPIPRVLLTARWYEPFEPINIDHPTPGSVPNFEAHNSILEVFIQGGLLGGFSLAALYLVAFIRTLRAGQHALATTILCIFIFGSFHVITRHPSLWFIFALSFGAPARSTAAKDAVSGVTRPMRLRVGEV